MSRVRVGWYPGRRWVIVIGRVLIPYDGLSLIISSTALTLSYASLLIRFGMILEESGRPWMGVVAVAVLTVAVLLAILCMLSLAWSSIKYANEDAQVPH